MGYAAKKTEHSGTKKGCGAYWGRKADAKNRAITSVVNRIKY